MKESKRGVAHFFAAFRYTIAGLGAALKHEAAFRQDVVLAVLDIAGAWALALSGAAGGGWMWFAGVQTALAALLLAAELLNSAIEAITDLASPGWHELAKRAKDMGSAAVGVVVAAIVLLWLAPAFAALAH